MTSIQVEKVEKSSLSTGFLPAGYPLPPAALAAALGAVAAYRLHLLADWRMCIGAAAVLGLLAWLSAAFGWLGRGALVSAGAVAALLLGVGAASRQVAAAGRGRRLAGGEREFEASIVAMSGLDASQVREARLQIERAAGRELAEPVLALAYLGGPLTPGDRVALDASLRPLDESDYYEQLLAAAGVAGRLRVHHIQRVGSRWSLSRLLYKSRLRLAERFRRQPLGAFFAGLMLGDGKAFERETYVRARLGGTVHVLVVSGLHVGIAGGLAIWLARRMRLRLAARNLLAIGITLAYVLLAGFGTSALRAWLMFSILVAAPLLRREYDTLNSLAAAVLLIVLLRPHDVLSRGFSLSLAAIGGILLAAELLPALGIGRLSWWQRRFLEAAGVSLGAWLAVAPLCAYYYALLNPLAPVLALLSVPVLAGYILAGWLAVLLEAVPLLLLAGWSIGAAGPAYWLVSGLAWLLDALLDGGGIADASRLTVWGPPVMWLAVYYVLLVVAVVFFREHRYLSKRLPAPARVTAFRQPFFMRCLVPVLALLLAVWPLAIEALAHPADGLYCFSGAGEALAVVDREAGILVFSESAGGGRLASDALVSRMLRRRYRLADPRATLDIRHGRYHVTNLPGSDVVRVETEDLHVAWSRGNQKALAAAAQVAELVLHTGRDYSGRLLERCDGSTVAYVPRLGGAVHLAAGERLPQPIRR